MYLGRYDEQYTLVDIFLASTHFLVDKFLTFIQI